MRTQIANALINQLLVASILQQAATKTKQPKHIGQLDPSSF